jgi:regulator of protease activity HflC (stomatin/prohibitin superfamily)
MPQVIAVILWVILIIVILALFFSCLHIVPQESAYVIEHLGRYHATWDAGIHFKVPVLDRISRKVLEGTGR